MIESNIVKWVDLGDSMQSLDVYSKKKWVKFFNLIRVMISFKKFSIFFYIVLKCFFFLQIIMLNLINIPEETDSAIQILKYISKVIFIQEIVTDNSSYKIAVLVNSMMTLILLLCIVYLMISVKIGKFFMKIPIVLLNLINIFLLNYLLGPIIFVSILVTKCTNGTHDLMGVPCYSDSLHLIFFLVSIVNLVFSLTLSIILSIYYNEIGSINETKFLARINCNYEIYTTISKITMFIFGYFVQNYGVGSDTFKIILQIYLLVNTFGFAVYTYRNVLFYDPRINTTILYGWIFVSWFSVVIFLKTLLNINDTSIFHLAGWLIISFIVYYMEELKEEYLLTDFNIFEAKSLKDIELFNFKLFNLMNMRSVKNKTLLVGIIKKFEEVVKSNEELKDKYNRLSSNEHLKKKFNSNTALSILSIVYIIYDHHLDKSVLKNDILLNVCYFLMNKFKNVTYAVYLCSKIKAVSHKHLYFKYLLMEEIKAYLINKLSKSNNKESIKHIQIGSVILYNIYMELFKTKIYDAACNQIDYFDLLRNNVTTPKTTENFLKLGEDILSLRKEILKIWERILELNPFSEECGKDYMMYLETILQDDVLARAESKKFSNFRASKLSERNNIYHSLFTNNSGVLLIDGYSTFGKVLYTTPNFPQIFNFSGKDVLNMTVDDFVPNVIKEFHKEVIDNGIRYSNINYIFGSQREMLLKGKTGSIYTIKLFLKCVPNLSYGLIYMVSITKLIDHNYVVVLDKDFKINGLTDIFSQGGNYSNSNYALDRNIINCHMGLIIPDLLLQLEYKEGVGFFVVKEDVDLKGVLYTLNSNRGINERIERLLEKIKQHGKLHVNDENKQESLHDYEDLLKEISGKATNVHSVFYKINTRVFMRGKFKYHKVYISNDLISMNENTNSYPSGNMSSGFDPKKPKNKNAKKPNENRDSGKQVKIRLNNNALNSGEEGNKLIDENENNDREKNPIEEPGKKHAIKDDKNKEEISRGFSSNNTKSFFSRSSVDSASFNKLKNGILEKKEVSSIKFMKYLSVSFLIGTILLVFFASQNSNQKFENLNNYLLQNLYFNHSKIAVSCVHLNTLNLKFLRHSIYSSDHCYKPCRDFYSTLLAECITDIKTEKENSSYFYQDFKDILNRQKDISLEIYNMTIKDKLPIDIENDLNLIVAFGLKLNANLNDYFTSSISTLNTVSNNLLTQSFGYLKDKKVSGFTDTQKEDKISSSYFSPVNIVLIVEGVLFCILLVAFIYLICSLYNLESFYLKKLIKFKNPPFEIYLKKLDEIKKRLRNDNGEDDEKFNNDLDMQDFNNLSKRSKDDEEKGDKKKEKRKKKDDDDKDDKDEKHEKERKAGLKRKNNKKIVKNYQEDKMNIMGKYFLLWNTLFCVKVIAILLLSVSYYLVVSIIDQSTQSKLLSFDSTSNDIEGVFKESFDIYLGLKTELANYIDWEIQKRKLAALLNGGFEKSVIFNGQTFTSGQTLLNYRVFYNMKLPQQVVTPKIGSLLMPLVNTDLTTASAPIVSLNNLYNVNSCAVLFDQKTRSADYSYCASFWSSILIKGMEQSITQMSVVVTTVLDDLHSLNLGKKSLQSVIANNSPFSGYEMFVEFYLFKAYMKTVGIFRSLNSDNLLQIYEIYKGIMIAYICFVVILFGLLYYFVYKSKYIFNTFMNFIGILPAKYLIEDANLYKEILKLEQYIYY